MMAGASAADVISVDVDITPLPTVLPPAPVGESPASSGWADHGWLATTGSEPAWMLLGAVVVLVALGLVLVRTHRRRSRLLDAAAETSARP